MKTDTPSPSTPANGQSRAVLIWKLFEFAGLLLFVVIVPRLMGPDLYGNFAVILSLIGLLTMASGLGALPAFGRFIPEYEARAERSRTKAIFMQLFCVRLVAAGILGIFILLVLPRLLPGASPLTIAAGAGAFFFGALAMTFYQIFYGLNNLGRWLSQEALTRYVLILLFIILGGRYSLEGAAVALLVTQLTFFLLGLFWTRSFFTFRRSALHFSELFSHLSFGILFFSANLMLMVVWRSGEIVIALFSGRGAEVAFFNVAVMISLAFYTLINQIAAMIVPRLTTLHVSGEKDKVHTLLGYSLKYLTIASFSFLFVVHLLGPWIVGLGLGEEYLPVVANLRIFVFALLPLAFVRTGTSLAVLHKQPGKVIRVTAGALATFILAAALLVPSGGSYGASAAVALAFGSAGVITYHQFSLGPVLSVARFWRLMLIGLIALGVMVLPLPPAVPAKLLAIVLYVFLLFWSNVISAREVWQLGQGLVTARGWSDHPDLGRVKK